LGTPLRVKVSVMPAGGFHGDAKTVAPSSTARLAVARSRLKSDWFSPTGIRSTENPSRPSPLPKAVSRWAAVRSPIQAAWDMAPKPLMVCFRADGLMFAAAAEASVAVITDAVTVRTGTAANVVRTTRRLSSRRSPATGSFSRSVIGYSCRSSSARVRWTTARRTSWSDSTGGPLS
jgi:hypothetical protein